MSTRHTRSGAERVALRGRLHGEAPAIRVGRDGLTAAVVGAVEEVLAAREVIKVRFEKGSPVDAREGGRRLAELLGAELLGRIGRVAMLYRPRPREDRSGGEVPGSELQQE